jgi:hypothetical protein
MTTPHDPELAGRQLAEALMASLEQLKTKVGGGPDADPAAQLRASELAVEAMKHLLPDVTGELHSP